MKATSEELQAAALDARLSFSLEEEELLLLRFQEFMEQVQQVKERTPLAETPPLPYPHGVKNTWRDDQREASLTREEALANGPDTDSSCFHVPRIVEG